MKDREEVKDRERSEEGGRGDLGGLHRGQGSLALRGEGVRSGGSPLLPPTVFSGAVTAGGWGGAAGRRGEEAAGEGGWGGGKGAAGDRAGVVLPLAEPGTAMETALPTRLARAPAACRLQLARPPPSLPPSLRASLPPPPSVPASRARPAAPSVSATHPRSVGAPLSRRQATREPRVGGRQGEARGGARGRVRGGELDGGDLEGEGQGRRRQGGGEDAGGEPASLVRRFVSCPHPTPVFDTNTSSERQLVVFGEEEACVTVCIREGLRPPGV